MPSIASTIVVVVDIASFSVIFGRPAAVPFSRSLRRILGCLLPAEPVLLFIAPTWFDGRLPPKVENLGFGNF
jgi:hypothetical protein